MDARDKENFEILIERGNIKIKRITSPKNFKSEIFIQEEDEWVMVIQGSAELDIAGRKVKISEGEHIFIPRKTYHQILKTSDEIETVWLAVYLSE